MFQSSKTPGGLSQNQINQKECWQGVVTGFTMSLNQIGQYQDLLSSFCFSSSVISILI